MKTSRLYPYKVPVLAMILAGGQVNELSVLTFFRPKAAVPFGGIYRVIDFPMSNLMHSGIWTVGVLSQYRPYSLLDHLDYGIPWDMVGRKRGVYILPPFQGREASDWYKGTADAVYQNLEFIKRWNPKEVLILSGDHVYSMDYRPLLEFHREKNADLTIAFTEVPIQEAYRFGQGKIEKDSPFGGKLLDYAEKVAPPISNWASLTIYVFRPEVLEEVLKENALKDSHEFGRDIIPSMLGNYKIYGFLHRGYWGYTRTIKEYWQTHMDLLGKDPQIDLKKWKICTNLAHRYIRDRKPSLIGKKAEIKDSIFHQGCIIKGKVIRSILSPGVHIEEGAEIKESIILYDTKIEKGAQLYRVICDTEVHIGENAEIGNERDITLIGRRSQIPSQVQIGGGVVVYPELKERDFLHNSYWEGAIIKNHHDPQKGCNI